MKKLLLLIIMLLSVTSVAARGGGGHAAAVVASSHGSGSVNNTPGIISGCDYSTNYYLNSSNNLTGLDNNTIARCSGRPREATWIDFAIIIFLVLLFFIFMVLQ